MIREHCSSFKFFTAIASRILGDVVMNGEDIDTRGFESLTLQVPVGCIDSTTAVNYFALRMQHTDDSGLGPSNYADCTSVEMIRFGESGAVVSGIWHSVVTTESGDTLYVGYRGDKRYVRALIEPKAAVGSGVSQIMGIVALLGHAGIWPVATPNA